MGVMKRQIEARAEMRRLRKKSGRGAMLDELFAFERGWAVEMTNLWREKMEKVRALDSGTLYRSVQGVIHPGPVTTIEHTFMLYGIYVEAGVGREFAPAWGSRGDGTLNSGQLPFLLPGGEDYRRRHRLDRPRKVGPAWGGRVAGGHPRQPKPWYSRKYYASVMKLNEVEADFYGSTYNGLISSGLDEIFSGYGAARNL
ncbi:hypothetical protein [Segatella buccae]|uniref:hypothetical protein n=1 Tax=Segatella buccae TaxID=28126 RepID=UPI0028D4E5DF|nr:hypothetical protein [Segatella buccae]